MNKWRRKWLEEVRSGVEDLQSEVETLADRYEEKEIDDEELKNQLTELADACQVRYNDVEASQDEEQEYLDNMPESLKGGDKASTAESAIEAMGNAMEELDSAKDTLEEWKDNVGTDDFDFDDCVQAIRDAAESISNAGDYIDEAVA